MPTMRSPSVTEAVDTSEVVEDDRATDDRMLGGDFESGSGGWPGGQVANAWPTVCRRGLTAVGVFAERWPLISSIRLSSSTSPWLSQRHHR